MWRRRILRGIYSLVILSICYTSEDWDKDSVSEREQEPMTAPVYEEESDTDIPFPTPVQKRIKRANAGTNQRYKD
jgi:hypothetical protein